MSKVDEQEKAAAVRIALPPETFQIRYCRVCGRHGLYNPLTAKHYARGRLCEGVPETVIYRRVDVEGGL